MKYNKTILKIIFVALTFLFFVNFNEQEVYATNNKDEIKDKIEENEDKLDDVNNNINALTQEQELIEEELADMQSELINTLTSVGLIEDEIEQNQLKLDELMVEYSALNEIVIKQEEEMQLRMQYMYENGSFSYVELLLKARSFKDFLTMTEYISGIYEYDEKLLEQYNHNKASLECIKIELEDEKVLLEDNKEKLEIQSTQLEQLMEVKREVSENFEADIAKAKQEAAIYKEIIKQEEAELERIEEEERAAEEEARREEAAGNIGDIVVTGFDTTIIDNATGSDLGKTIAKYACQFIGNPYVYGGTSLTTGADCSGFTYRVYKDFGYTLDRTSTDQRSNGTAVASLNDAQPGDIICYSGHVAIYVGGGYIVHASSPSTGIKIGEVGYKPILAIRRII